MITSRVMPALLAHRHVANPPRPPTLATLPRPWGEARRIRIRCAGLIHSGDGEVVGAAVGVEGQLWLVRIERARPRVWLAA